MIARETKEKVAELLGFKGFEARRYEWLNEEKDDFERAFDVTLMWVAELGNFRLRTATAGIKNMTLGVVKAQEWRVGEWRKGVLLVPSQHRDTGENYVGGSTLLPVNLTDDPVEEQLQHFDLTFGTRRSGINESAHYFHVSVVSQVVSSELEIYLQPAGESNAVENLRWAIHKVVRDMLDKYNNDEMNQFFEQLRED